MKEVFIPDLNFIENKIYKDIFQEWIDYKTERKEGYANQKSIEKIFKQLTIISDNNHKYARYIIDKSIANNYQGFFPMDQKEKDSVNGVQGGICKSVKEVSFSYNKPKEAI